MRPLAEHDVPAALWRDLLLEVDGQPQTFARMALAIDEAPLLDAANPHGFAAHALLAAMAELYPNGEHQ